MNQLPENMGKKIVEALKKQAQSESETFDKTVIEQNQVLTEKTQNIIREEIDPQVTDVIKEEIDVQQKIKPQVEYAQPIISQPMQQSVPHYGP